MKKKLNNYRDRSFACCGSCKHADSSDGDEAYGHSNIFCCGLVGYHPTEPDTVVSETGICDDWTYWDSPETEPSFKWKLIPIGE